MHFAVVEALDDSDAIDWRPGDPGLLPLVLRVLHRRIGSFDPVEIPELEASGRAIVAEDGLPPELEALWDEDEANAAVVLGFAALVAEEIHARSAGVEKDTREAAPPELLVREAGA